MVDKAEARLKYVPERVVTMIDTEILEQINSQMSKEGIPHIRRPFEAIVRLSKQYGIQVKIPSAFSDEIFTWFNRRTKPGSDFIGSLYKSAYYYDSEFWPVKIPIIYGSVALDPMTCITGMPEQIREGFHKTRGSDYLVFWADCMDYAFGFDALARSHDLDMHGLKLIKAADQKLRSSVTLLLEARPNKSAIMRSRMATEIFMKSYIALKIGLSEKEAKDIGHNLKKGLDQFIAASGMTHLKKFEEKLVVFPPMGERYSEQLVSSSALWDGFVVAQSFGVLVTREFTKRRLIEPIIQYLKSKKFI